MDDDPITVYCLTCKRVIKRWPTHDVIAADATIARHERRFPAHRCVVTY